MIRAAATVAAAWAAGHVAATIATRTILKRRLNKLTQPRRLPVRDRLLLATLDRSFGDEWLDIVDRAGPWQDE